MAGAVSFTQRNSALDCCTSFTEIVMDAKHGTGIELSADGSRYTVTIISDVALERKCVRYCDAIARWLE